jgi:hypothetical protein
MEPAVDFRDAIRIDTDEGRGPQGGATDGGSLVMFDNG